MSKRRKQTTGGPRAKPKAKGGQVDRSNAIPIGQLTYTPPYQSPTDIPVPMSYARHLEREAYLEGIRAQEQYVIHIYNTYIVPVSNALIELRALIATIRTIITCTAPLVKKDALADLNPDLVKTLDILQHATLKAKVEGGVENLIHEDDIKSGVMTLHSAILDYHSGRETSDQTLKELVSKTSEFTKLRPHYMRNTGAPLDTAIRWLVTKALEVHTQTGINFGTKKMVNHLKHCLNDPSVRPQMRMSVEMQLEEWGDKAAQNLKKNVQRELDKEQRLIGD